MPDEFSDLDALLDSTTIQVSAEVLTVSQRNYALLSKNFNCTTFSQLEVFHSCPRRYVLNKFAAAGLTVQQLADQEESVHFAFGHAVGAGVAEYLRTKDLDLAKFAAFLAWGADFFAAIDKKQKNIHSAMIAIELFASYCEEALDEWELLILPDGKPAIELSLSLHCENGFKHYCHLDIALRNKRSKRIAVLDTKSTGLDAVEEALYANSAQALSYSVVLLAALPEELHEYEVYYMPFSTTARQWDLLAFTKSVEQGAEFVKDLLLTHSLISTYEDVGFYPKRGGSCYDYRRRCKYFGSCDSVPDSRLPRLADEEEAEATNFVVPLESVIEELKKRKRVVPVPFAARADIQDLDDMTPELPA